MHYVIIRDDDTNALTPVECLERLYRPALDYQFPINLSTIPFVSTLSKTKEGKPEGFLFSKGNVADNIPIFENRDLVHYLKSNPFYNILQHGYQHDYCEFELNDPQEIKNRIKQGFDIMEKAGFPKPITFVAPHDRFTATSLQVVSEYFKVISSGWYELERLPVSWWPNYFMKKITGNPHWKKGDVLLLTHPGCNLSYHHPLETMLETIKTTIHSRQLTVLVTHWWEYFIDGPNEEFIKVLHQTLKYLHTSPDIKVISFNDLIGNDQSILKN